MEAPNHFQSGQFHSDSYLNLIIPFTVAAFSRDLKMMDSVDYKTFNDCCWSGGFKLWHYVQKLNCFQSPWIQLSLWLMWNSKICWEIYYRSDIPLSHLTNWGLPYAKLIPHFHALFALEFLSVITSVWSPACTDVSSGCFNIIIVIGDRKLGLKSRCLVAGSEDNSVA